MLKPENYYLLRTPILDINIAEELLQINQKEKLFERLNYLFNDEQINEALFIASPVLHNEINKISNNNTEKEKERIYSSLLKYLIRCSTRCTPFGMFSGVTLGHITKENSTNIIISERKSHKRSVRLDMGFLNHFITELIKIPEINDNLIFKPNNSYYLVNDRINYYEVEKTGKINSFNLSSVEITEVLSEILKISAKGLTLTDICSHFSEIYGEQEIKGYVLELINNQILLPDIYPPITGKDSFSDFLKKFEKININKNKKISDILSNLYEIKNLIFCSHKLAIRQQKILEKIGSILKDFSYEGNIFQVDLYVTSEINQISYSVLSEITKQVKELLSTTKVPINNDLEDFKVRYRNRYEEQEIPLMEALDTEYGIGYGNSLNHLVGNFPLVGEVDVNNVDNDKINKQFNSYDLFIQNKYFNAIKNKQKIIYLEEQDINYLKKLTKQDIISPESCYILGSLINQEDGNFEFLLSSCNGPSSTTLMSRFCYLDKNLEANIKQSIALEDEYLHEKYIIAEIVHSPQATVGNIIYRPILRNHEIPLISEGGTEYENRILIKDLFVTVRNNEVILRSKTLNKRIIPKLTTAHNFTYASLPIYKFLSDLQFQNAGYSYAWGWNTLESLPFLPRVKYKNIVLSPAKWNIKIESISKNENLIKVVQNFLEQYQVPEFVLLIEGDNHLLINTKSENGLNIISKKLKRSSSAIISENLITSQSSISIDDLNKKYSNEIIIPCKTQITDKLTNVSDSKDNNYKLKRDFSLGSEWLYAKFYAGPKVLDKLLINTLPRLISKLKSKGLLKSWFFIRYNDPDSHIRIRFLLVDKNDYNKIIDEINVIFKSQIRKKIIYKIIYDYYSRELERYRGRSIIESENIFSIDSEISIRLLKYINEKERWLVALKLVDEYLNYFNLSIEQKIKFTEVAGKSFYVEFGEPSRIQKNLNSLFRKYSSDIESFFKYENKHVSNLFLEKENIIAPFVNTLKEKNNSVNNYLANNQLILSYIHMSINRFFPTYQRKYEMIIYHFLNKYLNSLQNRKK